MWKISLVKLNKIYVDLDKYVFGHTLSYQNDKKRWKVTYSAKQ